VYSFARAELIVCWVAWVLTFLLRATRRGERRHIVTNKAARWGMVLQGIGYALALNLRRPQSDRPGIVLTVVSIVLGPLACVLAWLALHHLGKQWRVHAGLYEDHELVTTGPYRWIRHPIYASMLALFLASGLLLTRPPFLLLAAVVFLAGTEIRVRVEEALLRSRFGEAFGVWSRSVPAYIPFVR